MTTLVTISDRAVTLKQALNWSVLFDQSRPIIDFVVENMALANEADVRGFEVTAEEVQSLFNEIRHMRRLESAEALRQWMGENYLEIGNIQSGCELIIKRRKLRDSISAEEIAGYYAENRPSYERVEIYRICVDQEDVAREIFTQITEEDESFCLTAIEQSTDADTAKKGGYVGDVGRKDLPGEVEAAVFGAHPGDVVGPVKTEIGWQVLMVHAARTIPLEEASKEIRDTLFQDVIAKAIRRIIVYFNYAE